MTESSKLCSKHFVPDQFLVHPEVAKKCNYDRIRLKPDAVPTIFDFPNKQVKKKRISTRGMPLMIAVAYVF